MVPSQGNKRQKVLRRLLPYGDIPAWTRKPLFKRRLKLPWRTRRTPKISFYGRCLYEKQRIRFHFNLKESQLQGYFERAFKKGVRFPNDVFMQQLESRLDNFIWRVGLAPTMAAARFMVKGGHMQYYTESKERWVTCNVPSLRLKVGDQVRVRRKNKSMKMGRRIQEDTGFVKIPSHITWDREELSGQYLDVCDWQEFGIEWTTRYLFYNYIGPKGLRRDHTRYYDGTTIPIPKKGYGGRTRPTPENIYNIKKGVGLNRRGRRRPPCLWGRRRPLNNAYEVSNRIKV